MQVFGPWIPLLLGVGAVLLAGGLLVKELAPNSLVRNLGRGAANAGWRMMLLGAAIYFLILALAAAFESLVSNLPGT